MRIVVTGRKGQVVSALIERGPFAGHVIVPVGRPEFDLARPSNIATVLASARPDLVVSAAAYTAVDKAENDRATAFALNGIGAGAVAAAAAALSVPIIHLSTDYVFDGLKPDPYIETDATAPLGVYGASKLDGERRVAAATPNHAILRVAWIYSPFGLNFVRTMLRLAESRDTISVVSDQIGGPTSAHDIADAIFAVGERIVADPADGLRGMFHLPSEGTATWATFAETIFAMSHDAGGRKCLVSPIATADYPTDARRPANSCLDGSKIDAVHGIRLPDWRTSLKLCVDRLIGMDRPQI